MRPYDIIGDFERFDQRNTAFARARWDETSAAHGRPRISEEENIAKGRPGYSREDFALHSGSWSVARGKGVNSSGDRGRIALESDAPEKPGETPADPVAFTRSVKRASRLFGACLAGVAAVDERWLYAGEAGDLPEGLDKALVMAVPMSYRLIQSSPAVPASAATGSGYSRMAFVNECMIKHLRDLGYRAIAASNDRSLSVPLAVEAGLGELGRNGILITERYGPRVRLCKVFTDAPLVADQAKRRGVREFCETCMKCADTCPSRSITRGEMTATGPTPSNHDGVVKWRVNPDTCLAFWRANGVSCSNCIRSCPYNKPPGLLHDAARAVIRLRSRALNRALVWFDDLCGYGRQRIHD